MPITEAVGRRLLASSGGYCANPDCHGDLFSDFTSGRVATLAEIAHVIAERDRGPRGHVGLAESERDEYENLIILCPNCHTTVDKYAMEYPVKRLLEWKKGHVERIRKAFMPRSFGTRGELRHEVARLLAENRELFTRYGPMSEKSSHPLSDASDMWRRVAIDKVIPNNREISALLHRNTTLLNEHDLQLLASFDVHKDGFAYNQLSGDKNTSVPTFPPEMNEIVSD